MDPSGIAVRSLDLRPIVLRRYFQDMDRSAQKGLGDHFRVVIRGRTQVAYGDIDNAEFLGSKYLAQEHGGDKQHFFHDTKGIDFFYYLQEMPLLW